MESPATHEITDSPDPQPHTRHQASDDGHAQPSREPLNREEPDAIVELSLPIKVKRRGNEMRLIIEGADLAIARRNGVTLNL